MWLGSDNNVTDDGDPGQYPVMLSPDLVSDYDLYMEQEINMDMESYILHPNNHLNIVIISVLLVLGLTNNIIAFPVMLFRYLLL